MLKPLVCDITISAAPNQTASSLRLYQETIGTCRKTPFLTNGHKIEDKREFPPLLSECLIKGSAKRLVDEDPHSEVGGHTNLFKAKSVDGGY